MQELIKKAIKQIDFKQELTLIVSDETATKINAYKDSLLQSFPDLQSLIVTADSKLEVGDVIVESQRQRLDVRLKAQMATLLKNLKRKRTENQIT